LTEDILQRIETKLDLLLENQTLSKWLNISSASQYSHQSPRTLKRAIKMGELKGVKRHGHWMFHRTWIDRYIMFGIKRINKSEQKELEELS